MTDKQIIIDGVDVSGCIYYDANADKESYFLHDCKKEHAPCWSCSSMPSCLYKKYKRKEQECDMWKNLTVDNGAVALKYQQQLDQLKAENEKMSKGYSKLTEIVSPYMDDFTGYNEELGGFDIVLCVKELMEQLEAYKMEAEEGYEINAELKAELEQEKALKETYLACYKAKHEDIEGKLFKLSKTLTEIKEIAEKIDDSGGCAYGDYDCDNCSSLEQETVCTYKVKKLILQKISEVLE